MYSNQNTLNRLLSIRKVLKKLTSVLITQLLTLVYLAHKVKEDSVNSDSHNSLVGSGPYPGGMI